MHRLFVALRPPSPIRTALAQAMAGIPAARWQDDAQLHLTLRFIGTVDRPLAEDIATALSSLAAPAPTIAIAGVGRFEHRGRTEALWAAITPHDALAALHRKVDQALVRVGLAPERRAYLPHITLARMPRAAGVEAEVARWIEDWAALATPWFTPGHLILFESILGQNGASYEPVARWPLGQNGFAPSKRSGRPT